MTDKSTFKPNTNKVVDIKGSDSSTFNDDTQRSWRNNLSTIIKGVKNEGTNATIVGMNETKDSRKYTNISEDILDVKDGIYLCMESIPTMKFEVGTNDGLKDFITGIVGESKLTKSQTVATRVMAAINVAASAGQAASGTDATAGTLNPWSLWSPTWDEEQATFSFTQNFHFRMGQYGLWNAKEEVVKPLLNLIAPVMNQQIGSVFTKGPFPSCLDLLGKCIQNVGSWGEYMDGGTTMDTVKDAFSDIKTNGLGAFLNFVGAGVELLGSVIQSLVLCGYRQYTYDIKFGDFVTFNKVMYTSAEVTWSNETDQFGFPIAGSATINFKSILPPAITSKNRHTMFADFAKLGDSMPTDFRTRGN